MTKRFAATLISLAAMSISAPVVAAAQNVARQPGAVYDFDRPNEKPGPAPKRDLSGVWEPARGPGAGLQGKGALSMGSCEYKVPGVPYTGYAYDAKAPVPDCLKPKQEPPYTALGRDSARFRWHWHFSRPKRPRR